MKKFLDQRSFTKPQDLHSPNQLGDKNFYSSSWESLDDGILIIV